MTDEYHGPYWFVEVTYHVSGDYEFKATIDGDFGRSYGSVGNWEGQCYRLPTSNANHYGAQAGETYEYRFWESSRCLQITPRSRSLRLPPPVRYKVGPAHSGDALQQALREWADGGTDGEPLALDLDVKTESRLSDGLQYHPATISFDKLWLFLSSEAGPGGAGEILRVKFLPRGGNVAERWEVPNVLLPPEERVADRPRKPGEEPPWEVTMEEDPWKLQIARKATGEILWEFGAITFAEQFLEISSRLDSDMNIFGIGEHRHELRMGRGEYTLMSTDPGSWPYTKPLYGSQPVYQEVRNTFHGSYTHGGFMLNSNPMTVTLEPDKMTWRMSGGIIDLFLYLGPTPEKVTQQHQHIVGKPQMPALWTIGFHQSRWGYKELAEVQEVVRRYEREQVPSDAVWLDLDYMDAYKDFTINEAKWPEAKFKAWADTELHPKGQHLVLIIDPSVKIQPGYSTYDEGVTHDIFIREPGNSDQHLVGKVWPGLVHFPDFTNPKAQQWWDNEIKSFHDKVSFDGLWTDMNEPANFCDGRCLIFEAEEKGNSMFQCRCTQMHPKNEYDLPPFWPGGKASRGCRTENGALDCSTISMGAKYYPYESNLTIEYNMHNLFGHHESISTKKSLARLDPKKRPFVLTRSNFPGTGRHAAHWLGDNKADWGDMRASIAGILAMNLYGIPHVGGDICGFFRDTTPELCTRWFELGAMSPFARTHNAGIWSKDQYPWSFPGTGALDAIRNVLLVRYSIISHFYTLFYRVASEGGTVARPLYFEFPSDAGVLGGNSGQSDHGDKNNPMSVPADDQFLLGSGLMVSPVVYKGQTSRYVYFPGGPGEVWFDFYTGQFMDPPPSVAEATKPATAVGQRLGFWRELPAPWGQINLHIRGGTMVSTQVPGLTTRETLYRPYRLKFALPPGGDAHGMLYLDSGDGPMPWEEPIPPPDSADDRKGQSGVAISYTVTQNTTPWALTISARSTSPGQPPLTCEDCGSEFVLLREITIFGVPGTCQPTGLAQIDLPAVAAANGRAAKGVAVVRPFTPDNWPDGPDFTASDAAGGAEAAVERRSSAAPDSDTRSVSLFLGLDSDSANRLAMVPHAGIPAGREFTMALQCRENSATGEQPPVRLFDSAAARLDSMASRSNSVAADSSGAEDAAKKIVTPASGGTGSAGASGALLAGTTAALLGLLSCGLALRLRQGSAVSLGDAETEMRRSQLRDSRVERPAACEEASS